MPENSISAFHHLHEHLTVDNGDLVIQN